MIPDELKYSKEHEWVRIGGGNDALVGITKFAADELGDVVFLDLPEANTVLKQFEKFGEIESVKAVSEIYSPISGNVLEINEQAINNPQLVNESPYDKGWLVKIDMNDLSELETLMNSREYEAFVANEGH